MSLTWLVRPCPWPRAARGYLKQSGFTGAAYVGVQLAASLQNLLAPMISRRAPTTAIRGAQYMFHVKPGCFDLDVVGIALP